MAVTKLLRIKQTKGSEPSRHLRRNINYICNPKKTGGGLWISGNAGSSPEAIYRTMMINKEAWGKLGGTQGFHYVLSFHPNSGVDEQIALKVAEEFCEELLGGDFYYCIAVHNDQQHMHAHITFDSVSSKDGYKFHSPKGDWNKRIQPITDRICEEYGLETLEYDPQNTKGIDHGSWESAKGSLKNLEWSGAAPPDGDGKVRRIEREETFEYSPSEIAYDEDVEEAAQKNRLTWHDILRADIDDAIASSSSYRQFIDQLRSQKYEVRDGKYISLKAYGQMKAMRTHRLGSAYEKEAIMQRIQSGRERGKIGTYYGDRGSVNRVIRRASKRLPGWKMSEMQVAYFVRYHQVSRLRHLSKKDRWEQKKRLLSLAAYARQITFMVKYGIRTMEDLNAKKEETKGLLRVTNRRLSEGIGDRELLLAYRRNLLKRIRLCDGIAKDNLSAQATPIARKEKNVRI